MPIGREDRDALSAGDLVTVIDAFDAVWNTHHLDGLLGCLVEDATVTLVQGAPDDPTVYRGQAEIRSLVRTYLPHGHLCSRRHYRADGDRVVWMVRVTADCFQPLGIDWVECRAEAIVRGGKIVTCTVTPTPESLATLETAKQGSEAETSADPLAETRALSAPARLPGRCLRAHHRSLGPAECLTSTERKTDSTPVVGESPGQIG